MSDRSRSRFPALPPRPEPSTGEPFPPHGRAFRGNDGKPRPEHDRDRETRLSHKPEAPTEMGPVLAWHKESKRGKFVLALLALGTFVVGLTVLSVLRGDGGFDWVPYWQIWVLIATFTLLATMPATYFVYSAGADWFKCDVVRFGIAKRSGAVKLYELKKITADFVPAGGTQLYLSDGKNAMDLTLAEYQLDRRIWDLVYNGILHSVAADAQLNEHALKVLELDQVPELCDPEGLGDELDDDDEGVADSSADRARTVGPEK